MDRPDETEKKKPRPEGKPRRLRGLCAKVVRPGPVRPGDEVVVIRPDAGAATSGT